VEAKGRRTDLREFKQSLILFEGPFSKIVIAAGFWMAQPFVQMRVLMEFIWLQKEHLAIKWN